MPKKAAGDQTIFEVFAELHPQAAVHLIKHHGGERIELQPFANKVWRTPDTDTSVRSYVSGELTAGVPYERAIKSACKVFDVKASRIRALIGPAPTPEETQDEQEDEESAEYDEVEYHGTVLLIPRQTPPDTILRRILTSMPHRNRNSTIRMRRLLVDLNLDQVGDLPGLLGYGWGLRPIPIEKKRAVFARLSSYSPAGRATAHFLDAQATASPQLPKMTRALLAIAEKTGSLRRLINAAERQYDSSEEFWWSFEEGLDMSKWQIHADDDWDPRHDHVDQHLVNYMMGGTQYGSAFLALESFALTFPSARVLAIPTDPERTSRRNDEIRREFRDRREACETAAAVIGDLASRHFLGTKQIESIVYGPPDDEPKNLQ